MTPQLPLFGSSGCARCGGALNPFMPPLAENFARTQFFRLLCVSCARVDVAEWHAAAAPGKGVTGCTCAYCTASRSAA